MQDVVVDRLKSECSTVTRFLPCLRISEPCYGIGGFRALCDAVGIAHSSVNSYEKDARYSQFYKVMGYEVKIGDLLDIDPNSLEDAHGLVAGPPCVPWAGNGGRLGCADIVSQVFERLLVWIASLAHRGCLLFFCLENSANVVGSEHYLGHQQPSWISQAIEYLNVTVPFFHVDFVTIELSHVLPQRRCRCWLRGIRRYLADRVPPVLQRLPSTAARDILDFDSINISSVDSLSTKKLRENFLEYEARIKVDVSNGRAGEFAFCELSRSASGVFSSAISYDIVPPLRSTGQPIFCFSCTDIAEHISQRKLVRYLAEGERFRFMGHPASLADRFPVTLARHAAGNCYAVPMLALAVVPILQRISFMYSVSCSPYQGLQPLSEAAVQALIASSLENGNEATDQT